VQMRERESVDVFEFQVARLRAPAPAVVQERASLDASTCSGIPGTGRTASLQRGGSSR
jgi:hypothetical protein